MIFITTGTHESGFIRLVRAGDLLAGKLMEEDEDIIIQTGNSTYPARHAKCVPFLTHDEMKTHMQAARVVVCHAGAGTIIEVLKLGKPLVIAPRLKKYGEHHNDHQKQLALKVSEKYGAIVLVDVTDESLSKAISNVDGLLLDRSEKLDLRNALRQQLECWGSLSTRGAKRSEC